MSRDCSALRSPLKEEVSPNPPSARAQLRDAIIPAAMPNLGLESLGGLFLYFSAAFGAFLVALWLSLAFWTWRDIRARSNDRFLRVLAPLLVLLLSLPGVIVYLVLRPRLTLEEEYERALEEEALLVGIEEQATCPGCSLPGVIVYLVLRPRLTLEEEYERALEEEALLVGIEEQATCPGCSRRADREWQICPHCHTRLRKACVRCGRLLDLPWNLCPYCGTPAQPVRAETPAEQALPTGA